MTEPIPPVYRSSIAGCAPRAKPQALKRPGRSAPTPLKIFSFSTDFLQAIPFPAKNADVDGLISHIAVRLFFLFRRRRLPLLFD